jgi:hypothetical protein
MRAAISKMTFVFAFATQGLVEGQVADVAGEWSVVRLLPGVSPSVSPFEAWLRALPGAVFTLTPSVIPPLAMIRRGLGYAYSPSRPTITIVEGLPDQPGALGFLQLQVGRRFEGELASSVKSTTTRELSFGLPSLAQGGCWIHLSLEESEDGSTLSGSAWINTKISTRGCRSSLAKDFKHGEPFPYRLIRLK